MEQAMQTLVQTLGHTCQSQSEDNNRTEAKERKGVELEGLFVPFDRSEKASDQNRYSSFPCLSLSHEDSMHDQNRLSKDAIHHHASALLSHRVSVDSTELNTVPQRILDNLFLSFDRLVDARILAYSKILTSHSITLAENQHRDNKTNCPGSLVLEYKLKTLLEIGTNISAGEVITTFEAKGEATIVKDIDECLEIRQPVEMKVGISDLRIPCADAEMHSSLSVVFSASGVINGSLDRDTSKFLAIDVEIDCMELLSNMIDEASKVVGKVVDLTNTGWEEIINPTKVKVENSGIKRKSSTVSPELQPSRALMDDSLGAPLFLDSDPEVEVPVASLPHLVDYVMGEINEEIISPPAQKKTKRVALH